MTGVQTCALPISGHGGVAVGRHRLGRGDGAAAVEGGAAGEERITHL